MADLLEGNQGPRRGCALGPRWQSEPFICQWFCELRAPFCAVISLHNLRHARLWTRAGVKPAFALGQQASPISEVKASKCSLVNWTYKSKRASFSGDRPMGEAQLPRRGHAAGTSGQSSTPRAHQPGLFTEALYWAKDIFNTGEFLLTTLWTTILSG